jgi:hypothetical protein
LCLSAGGEQQGKQSKNRSGKGYGKGSGMPPNHQAPLFLISVNLMQWLPTVHDIRMAW